MKILRKRVYSHYLKKYKQASKMLKAAYANYDKLVGSFIETLNLCNCGNNSYWGNNPEKFFENQAALYKTKEQLKHYRKALAYNVSLAKSLLKQRQRKFTFAENNLHKAIKINGGISKRTAYDLLDTADIEKENYYKIESLTRYPINEWKVPIDESEDKPKMVIVMRKDLKVPKGKYCSQASHAAVGAIIQALYGSRLEESDFRLDAYAYKVRKDAYVDSATKDWLAGEFTKITVAVDSLEALEEIEKKAINADLNVCKITDNGHTCFDGVPTVTCLAIGPCYSSQVDPLTKDLKLF